MAKRRRSKARRHRMPPRNAKGRFMKRGARKAARRRGPARHVRRRRHRASSTLKRRYTPKYTRRARARRTKTGKHLRAVKTIRKRQRVAGLVRLNPREFAAITGNPRRRRRRRNPASLMNPRRRHRRRHARNPRGFSLPTVRSMLPIVAGGVGGGVLAGALDSSFLAEKSDLVKAGAKAAVAVASEALLRRRAPRVATGITGGLMGSVGYSLAVHMGGGVVADNKRHALKKVAAQGLGDPEMAAMLGDVVDANVLSDIANGEYDDHLADVVEA